jgi:hypothetical protein
MSGKLPVKQGPAITGEIADIDTRRNKPTSPRKIKVAPRDGRIVTRSVAASAVSEVSRMKKKAA